MSSLGNDFARVVYNDENLGYNLIEQGKRAGDIFWELPIVDAYTKQLGSAIADLRNIGTSNYGGAITAALFLEEFVPEKVPWAHLDIAGQALSEKAKTYTPKGGTGFGVRLLVEFLMNW